MLIKLTIAAGLVGGSALLFYGGWRQLKHRAGTGIAWSDNQPKPPFSHNIEH